MRIFKPIQVLSALIFAAALLIPPALAQAATLNWSGLDARFYDGPIPPPGTTIESVPLDPALSLTGAGPAYRVLYSTVDQHDQPAVSTGAVFLPPGPAPEGGFPVIAWAHGTEIVHSFGGNVLVYGRSMSYLNSVTTAHGVVDSVIAAHDMGLPLSPEWAIVGQSQGGGAAVASARWATEFSAGTGLDYRGVVATGTPANIDNFVRQAGPALQLPELGPVANAYTAYILAAFREARPDLDINSVLTPEGLAAAERAETVCVRALTDELADLTPAAFFSAPLSSIPGMADALYEYMGTPSTGFDRPLFLGVGLLDRDVPPASTLAFYDQLVANNQNVTLRIYPEEDHSGTVLASMADSTPFLRSVFAG